LGRRHHRRARHWSGQKTLVAASGECRKSCPSSSPQVGARSHGHP